MASPRGQDGCQPTLSSPDMPLQNDSPSLDPTAEDLTSDWTQWMKWDDIDLDGLSGQVDLSSSPNDSMKATTNHQTMVPSSFNLSSTEQPFSFTPDAPIPGSIPSNSPSISSAEPSNLFGSTFGLNTNPPQAGAPSRRPLSMPNRPQGSSPTTKSVMPLAPSLSPTDRKRKSLTEESDAPVSVGGDPSAAKTQPSKKRSHNVIEKRYRANLNDKIAELRDSVPSLRVLANYRVGGDHDDADATASGNKLNKASILSKATEYIRHLELRNNRLDEENIALKNRLRQLEKAQEQHITSISGSVSSPGGYTVSTDSGTGSSPGVFSHTEEYSPESSPNPLYPPEGLIKVPECFKKMRPTGPQPHYADSHLNDSPRRTASGGVRAPSKFMLGTLAGLMVVGGFENGRKTESSEKGLFAIPLQFAARFYRLTRSCAEGFAAKSWQIRALFQVSMTMMVVVGCAFFVFLYLFNSRPRRPGSSGKQHNASANSRISSPSEFRRDAWLTSIQTVWVPSHTFFPEWFAVTSRWVEYMFRCVLGWELYSKLTGITADDERARVKAWDIALDAQLTGGDPEVSKSRLVLTIFAAGTLPSSPARIMLKALHCRVLLWQVGNRGSFSCRVANHISGILAKYQWQLAQRMQESLPTDHEDKLPSHLATLVNVDFEQVFTDAIIQRASNMTWNRSTQEATDGEDAMLDVVVEDTAVRSPLDALASWWSSRKLQDTLIRCLDFDGQVSNNKIKEFGGNLDLALTSAPFASAAYTRAAVAKAVFFDEDRVANINSVLAALPRSKLRPTISTTNFLDSSVPPSARAEISLAVRCAMIAAILKGQAGAGGSPPSQLTLHNAIDLFNVLPTDPVELTLLGFASMYHLLHIVAKEDRLVSCPSLSSSFSSLSDISTSSSMPSEAGASDTSEPPMPLPTPDLVRIASGLIYWVRNAYNPISSGFTTKLMDAAVEGCVDVCRDAGLQVDVKKNEWQGHRRKKSHARRHTKSVSIGVKEDDGDGGDENRARSESVRSTDTGYGSLSQEESDEKNAENSVLPVTSVADQN